MCMDTEVVHRSKVRNKNGWIEKKDWRNNEIEELVMKEANSVKIEKKSRCLSERIVKWKNGCSVEK